MELAEHGLELAGTWLPGKSQDSLIPSTLVVKALPQPLAKEGQSQGDGSSLATTAGLWEHVPENRERPGQSFRDAAIHWSGQTWGKWPLLSAHLLLSPPSSHPTPSVQGGDRLKGGENGRTKRCQQEESSVPFGTALLAAVTPSLLPGKQCRAPRDRQMATTVSPALILPPRLLHHPKIPSEESNQKKTRKIPHHPERKGTKGTKLWWSTSAGVKGSLAAS